MSKKLFEAMRDITILCVEDEDDVRMSLVLFLKRRAKNVYEASNGIEGLEAFQKYKPDIVVTDIRMPQMNGLAMAAKIKEIDGDVPIVVISAFEEIEYLEKSINLGVSGYVLKPVDIDNLSASLYKCSLMVNFKKTQSRLKENEELFRVLTEDSATGVVLFNDFILHANPAFLKIFDYSLEEAKSVPIWELIKEYTKDSKELIMKILDQNLISNPEVEIKTKDGTIKYISIVSNKVQYKGEIVGIANIVDITERKWFETKLQTNQVELESLNKEMERSLKLIEQQNKQLQTQLYTDKLTLLPNRLKLIEDIRSSNEATLILLNIDDFKEINDFYGVDVGDFVLSEMANRILKIVQATHLNIYKLQADEYALFSPHRLDIQEIEYILITVNSEIENHVFSCKNQDIRVSISAGVAQDDGCHILAHADIALKRAKKKKKPYIIYDPSMTTMKEYEQNIKWLSILRNALNNNRIISYFQPIINNKNKKVEKFECLARLIAEDGKVYTPIFFLDISKRSRLYQSITRAIVKDAFEVFKNNDYSFSINLSIEDILDEKTNLFIKEQLDKYNISDRVIFEILESEGIENYELVATFIKEMKSYGCKIAIDDFGSGYSNFAHLLKLDVDFIKIDSSIIRYADKDESSKIISQTIVDFSKRLNIKTVAEFVYSQEIFDVVKEFGVDYSQGYFFGEPKREVK